MKRVVFVVYMFIYTLFSVGMDRQCESQLVKPIIKGIISFWSELGIAHYGSSDEYKTLRKAGFKCDDYEILVPIKVMVKEIDWTCDFLPMIMQYELESYRIAHNKEKLSEIEIRDRSLCVHRMQVPRSIPISYLLYKKAREELSLQIWGYKSLLTCAINAKDEKTFEQALESHIIYFKEAVCNYFDRTLYRNDPELTKVLVEAGILAFDTDGYIAHGPNSYFVEGV